jgi:NH3-dependent NAD+ synthetase
MYGKVFADIAQANVQSDEVDMGMTYDELTVSLLDREDVQKLTETSRHSAACARCINWVLLAVSAPGARMGQ